MLLPTLVCSLGKKNNNFILKVTVIDQILISEKYTMKRNKYFSLYVSIREETFSNI